MTNCAHENFLAKVTVVRLQDSGRFSADVAIKCAECGEQFRFLGLQAGVSHEQPMVSIDGLELRAPIEPEGEARLHTTALYQIPETPKRH